MNTIKIIIGTVLLCSLISCEQNTQYDYLMQNYDQLQKIYDHCKFDASTACDTVRHAMQDFDDLLNQQMMGPDQFGERIMSLQQQLITLSHEEKKAAQDHDEAKLKLVQAAQKDATRQLKIFYAVIKKVIVGE